jgi:hypothetical protein
MSKSHACRLSQWLLIALFVTLAPSRHANGDEVRLNAAERWTTAFADEEIQFRVQVDSNSTPHGTLQWSHSANQRVLARGESKVRAASDAAAAAKFTLRPGSLRDGVILGTTIKTEFVPSGSEGTAATLETRLTLFPRDPLNGRKEWAKQLNLKLFDPIGTTSRVFDSLNLPYRAVRNAAAIHDRSQNGILIVGEGASLVQNRTLAEDVLQAAARGRRVVMLAPADGSLPFPGTEGKPGSVFPTEMRFAGTHIISELDKRLDAVAWMGAGDSIPSSRLEVESYRGRVMATVARESGSWPWLSVQFPKARGTLVVCGFRIIKHWEDGPTPRYLLLKILESLQDREA